ncbi:MAG: pilus assembly protein PilM [Candidatus Omnitrophica bacterium]|nr:pilus assembly protein PilM [Candidatus Omnitrophota bacterium]
MNSSKHILSIDFGKGQAKIALLETGSSLSLIDYDITEALLNSNASQELASFISRFLKKNACQDKNVFLTFSDPGIGVFKIMTLPLLSKEETVEAVRWQMTDGAPFEVDTGIMDWKVIKEYGDPNQEKKCDIAAATLKKDEVDRCLSIVHECGLLPSAILNPFFNYASILNAFSNSSSLTAVLDCGREESTLCIYKNNQLVFIRPIAFSFNRLRSALAEGLSSLKGGKELSLLDAEKLLESAGIPENETGLINGNILSGHVISLVRPLLEALIKEIKLTFNYFSINFKEPAPEKLFITGEGSNIKRLDYYTSKELGVPTTVLSVPATVRLAKSLDKDRFQKEQHLLVNVVGSVMDKPHALNLLPLEVKQRKLEALQMAFLRVFTIGIAALFLIFYLLQQLEIHCIQSKLNNARAHLETIKRVDVLKEKIEAKEALIERLQKGKVPDHVLLKYLSQIMPADVILDGLTVNMQQHIFLLKGRVAPYANTMEVLVDFVKRLKSSKFFQEVSLLNSEDREGEHFFEIQGSFVK